MDEDTLFFTKIAIFLVTKDFNIDSFFKAYQNKGLDSKKIKLIKTHASYLEEKIKENPNFSLFSCEDDLCNICFFLRRKKTLLHTLCYYFNITETPYKKEMLKNCIEVLIKNYGSDVNFSPEYNCCYDVPKRFQSLCDRFRTPLYIAFCKWNIELFEFLVSLGADINLKLYDDDVILHNRGITLLHLLSSYHENEIRIKFMKCILKHTTDINTQNSRGETPLIIASKAYNIEFVSLILDKESVDVDLKDSLGRKALTYAVDIHKKKLVKLLLYKGGTDVYWDEDFKNKLFKKFRYIENHPEIDEKEKESFRKCKNIIIEYMKGGGEATKSAVK